MTLCYHLHQEHLQQNLGKFLPNAHPGATTKGDVLKPGGVCARIGHEALWLEVFFVGEDLCHIMSVADTVDDVPAFGNLVTLRRQVEIISVCHESKSLRVHVTYEIVASLH